MMQKRKRSDPNRPNWVQQLIVMKAKVETMPCGAERDVAHQRAKQLEAAISLDGWLRPTNRTWPMVDRKHADQERCRFFVIGDTRVGWSIRVVSDGGREEQLLGVYTTRAAAEDDLENAVRGYRKHG